MNKIILTLSALLVTMTSYGQELMVLEEPEIFKIVCEGNLVSLDSLLKQGNDFETQNHLGATLLHKAIECSQEEVVKYLIDQGLDVNVRDDIGRTPLFIAIETKNEKLVDLLMKKNAKADFDIIYGDGLSPVDKAILFGGLEYVKFLVENGANVNSINRRGTTPLGIAIRDGFDEIAAYLISKGADQELAEMPVLKGEYLGQEKPSIIPKMFAPGIVSIEHGNINASFHPNGREIYFTAESPHYNGGTIMVTKLEGDTWTTPETLEVIGKYTSWEPFISHDGMKLYYVSKRPVDPNDSINKTMDVWVLKREGNDWGNPIHLGDEVNTDQHEIHPSVASNGNLYYSNSGIRFSEFKDGSYLKSIPWTDPNDSLNWNADPFIAPDENYLIFASGRPGGYGGADMYISFRNEDGSWNPAKNMGGDINSEFNEFPSGLTPDGKYFIFASNRMGFFIPDIYWVDAQVIENLR